MLLKERTETVQTSGLGEGNNFTIAASAKAFEVLSSNLYQNKILAVIREITCNAADAHSMVSKDLSGIEVNLPTFNMPSFSVRDYGPGLSHGDVMDLYTTYFRSTKDNNASAIGGFGLGSKSPFAVADQFTVTSWHGHLKSVYVCYKQGGMPRVNHITSEPSTEPSGLLVTVVVKAQDRSEWTRNATNFFRFWPKLPKITGLDASFQTIWQTDEVLYKSSDTLNDLPKWAIFKGNRSATVFMGLVPYSLNFENLTKLSNEVATLLRGASLLLNMPVSSLQISPSREALSYDPDTVALLETTCIRIAKGIINEAIKDLDKLPTLYEARKFVWENYDYNTVRSAIQNLAEKGVIKWRGQTIPRHAVVPLHKVFAQPDGTYVGAFLAHTKRYRLKHFNTEHFGSYTNWASDASDTHPPHIVWTDKPISAKTYSTLRHNYYTLAGLNESNYCKIILISGPPYDKLCEETAKLGFPPIDNYDDLEEPPKAIPGSNPNRAPKTFGYTIEWLAGRDYYDTSRNTSPLDLKSGGLYVVFEHGEPSTPGTINALTYLATIPTLGGPNFKDTRIIGISKSRLNPKLKATLTANRWSCFDPSWLANHIPDATFEAHGKQVAMMGWLATWNKLSPSFVQAFVSSKNMLREAWPDEVCNFFTMIMPYVPIKSDRWPYTSVYASPFQGSYAIPAQAKANQAADACVKQVETAWKAVLTKHPMLKYVDNRIDPTDFSNYINR